MKQRTQIFDHDRVAHRETTRVPAATCSPAKPLVEDFAWDPDGLLRQEKRKVSEAVAPSIRDYIYTDKLRLWPNEVADTYLKNGAKAALVQKRYFDPRWGQVAREIDANNVEKQTQRDALGRVELEWFNGQLIRRTHHDWNTLPISSTTSLYSGNSGPEVVTRIYSDGLGRKRQTLTRTINGAVLSEWVAYDSLGNIAETALPTMRSDVSFVPRSASPGPLTTHLHDGLGRRITLTQADGRKEEWHFSVGAVEHVDRMGHTRRRYLDVSNRELALEELGTSGRYRVTRDGLGRIVATEDPDGSSRIFAYDESDRLVWFEAPHRKSPARVDTYAKCTDSAGRAVKTTTPQGRVVNSRYDELGRLLMELDRNGGELARYIYDEPVPYGRGRLTTVISDVGTEHFEYDEHGEVAKRTWESKLGDVPPYGNGTLAVSTKRDWQRRLIEQTLPADSGRIETTLKASVGYDERGLEKSLDIAGKRYAEVKERSPSGHVLRGALGNGLTERWTYSADVERLTSIEVLSASNAVLSRHEVKTYDANDNVKHLERTHGATQEKQTFAYDDLDRLTNTEWVPTSGTTTSEAYTYSPSGNLKTKAGITLEYGGVDPQSVSRRGATQYGYDFDGNLTSISGSETTALSWNERGLLVSVVRSGANSSTANRYFSDGVRAAKQSSRGWDQYFDSLELRAGGGSVYRLGLGPMRFELVLEKSQVTTKLVHNQALDRFLHLDMTGSVSSVSDGQPGNGAITYRPYGEVRTIDTKATGTAHRFIEKETDESGLAYFGARYHDAALGRWTSRDPHALSTPDLILRASPQTANLYAFADNNPVTRQDRNGLCTDDGCNAMGDAGVKMLSKPGGETIGKAAVGVTVVLAVVSLGLPFILTATPTEAALASGAGGAAVQASKVVPFEKLAELGSQQGTIVLGHYTRQVAGGVLPALERILEPAARQLGGQTLQALRPVNIETMKAAMDAATRIVFFTTPNMVGLTAQEMATIQSSPELMRKAFFVFGSN